MLNPERRRKKRFTLLCGVKKKQNINRRNTSSSAVPVGTSSKRRYQDTGSPPAVSPRRYTGSSSASASRLRSLVRIWAWRRLRAGLTSTRWRDTEAPPITDISWLNTWKTTQEVWTFRRKLPDSSDPAAGLNKVRTRRTSLARDPFPGPSSTSCSCLGRPAPIHSLMIHTPSSWRTHKHTFRHLKPTTWGDAENKCSVSC